MSSCKETLHRYAKRYLIDAMGAMAQGLFASLLVGTILDTIGAQFGLAILTEIGTYAKAMAGPAMAVAIGYALQASPLVLFSLATVGHMANSLGGSGGPLAVLIIAIIAHELGMLVSKKTKVDILVTPLTTILSGALFSYLLAPAIGTAASSLGDLIKWAMLQQPLLMGILVSTLVGIALTLPISSAAICAALGLTGLAGGAAVAGCCAQMVGFAVISFRESRWGGLVAQGLGTSMLQVPNIVRNPRIWLAPTLASAITGPLADGDQIEIALSPTISEGDVIVVSPVPVSLSSTGNSAHFGRQADPSEEDTRSWCRYSANLGWFPKIEVM